MHRSSRSLCACFLFSLFLVLPLSGQGRTGSKGGRTLPKDGVIVRVNDDVILASEVWKRLAPLLRYKKRRLSSDEFNRKRRKWFRKTTAQMIRSRVIQQAAEEAGLDVSEQEIRRELQNQIEEAGSREKFIRGLKQRGWTLEKWKRQKRKDLLQRKLFRQKFKQTRTNFFVSPEEIKTYYRTHKSQFYREPKVKGHIISIPFGERRSEKEALDTAHTLLRQIDDGARMDHLVEVYRRLDSEHTRTFDFVKKGTFSRKVEQFLFEKLDGNRVGGPVILRDRVVVLKRTGKVKEKKSSLEDPEVQQKIRDRLRNRKYREKLSTIEQQLLNQAYIKPRYLLQAG